MEIWLPALQNLLIIMWEYLIISQVKISAWEMYLNKLLDGLKFSLSFFQELIVAIDALHAAFWAADLHFPGTWGILHIQEHILDTYFPI